MLPLATRAQQSAMPVIGFLSSLTARDATKIMDAFHCGLADAGYVEGQNVAIEYRCRRRIRPIARRWPPSRLVHLNVTAIAAVSGIQLDFSGQSGDYDEQPTLLGADIGQ
jgi:hypothetical protein